MNEFDEDFHFSMDNGRDDYRELHQLLVGRRPSTRSRIETLNFQQSLILKLPTEVLLQIFHHLERHHLYQLLTVCRAFADLIIEILWFRPNMQNDGSFEKIRSIMKLPRDSTHWDYRIFIKRLNLLFMTKLVDDDLLSLFIGCPKLERLTLVNCTKLTHEPITKVLESCERLQSIDLTGVQHIHDEIIYALAKNCTRLQGLYAPGCGEVAEDAILTLLSSCKMLKRVKFNNSHNITDRTIVSMHENCRLLVEIDLHNCPNVTDAHLRYVLRDLTQLREFRISNALGITDDLFSAVPHNHHLEKLRIVDVTGCNSISNAFVEQLVRCAPRLRNVVLSKCMNIRNGALTALANLGRSLHYVHLGHCHLIDDAGVATLVRLCHRIQYIDLACCSLLSDETLTTLSTLPKLRRIGLVKCNLITDNGILNLVRRRGEHDCLERVHLSYCTNLTIGPIYLLLKYCPKLTHLSLTGITAFLRREITQYCRDPPPDFNEQQRMSFCVFSGQGVNQLRTHLNQVMEERAYLLEHGDFSSPINAIDRRRQFRTPEGTQLPPGAPIPASPPNFQNPGFIGMDAWAAQRGLGVLQNLDPPPMANGTDDDFNREIFRELDEGTMGPEQMREYFQNLFRQRNRQNALERRTTTRARNDRLTYTNAPQIIQPSVFPNDNEEDVDMEPVDLFPRNQ